MGATRQLSAIMFTDIFAYTALMGANEVKALETLRKSREIQKSAIQKHHGKWLKEMGDGVLAQFNSAVDAVYCALEIQKEASAELSSKIRIGIHLGDVTIENEDVFGDGVNIASRIQAIADPGGIYVSESVNEAVHSISGIKTEFLGDVQFKNVDRLIGTYCLIDTFLPVPTWTKRRRLKHGWSRYVLQLVLFMLVITAGLFLWNNWDDNADGEGPFETIAVLPFKNPAGDTLDSYFQAGIHNTIIDGLSQVVGFRVTPRRSTLAYKSSELSIREIGTQLRVNNIVEATVTRNADSLQLHLQLISVKEEKIVWSGTFRNSIEDVDAMQDRVVMSLADRVNVKLTPREKQRLSVSKKVNPQAYDDYLKGLFYWHQMALERSLQYFEAALKKDPDYAAAYAGIAMVWGGKLQMGLLPSHEAEEEVRRAASQALALDSLGYEVHYMLALYGWWDWDWVKTEKEYLRTIELNPSFADAQAYYADFLLVLGRPGEAMVQIEKALRIDPHNLLFHALHARDLNFIRRYDEAIAVIEEMQKVDANGPLFLSTLRTSYHLSKQYDKALASWIAYYSGAGDSLAVRALKDGQRDGGYPLALQRVAELLVDRVNHSTYVSAWRIATLYTRAGKKEEAVFWLEKAFEEHDVNMPYISIDPIFDVIQDDPKFQLLLQRMGLKRSHS